MKRKISILSVILPLLLTAAPLNMVFRNLNMSQGISDNHVRSILKDSYGMMWFVTLNGVNRYNGYHFKKYDIERNRYWNDALYGIYEDADSNIWVTGATHIYAYHRDRDVIDTDVASVLARYAEGWQGVPRDYTHMLGSVTQLFVDKDHNLWCRAGDTLYHYDFGRKRISTVDMPRGMKVCDLMCRNGKARMLCQDTSKGQGCICAINTGSGAVRLMAATGRTATERSRIYMDTNGRLLYYDLHEKHLLYLNEENCEWVELSNLTGMQGLMMTAVMDDGDGNIWIGTDNDGIFVMDSRLKTVSPVASRRSNVLFRLTDNHVVCFFKDDLAATMWVGMSKQGVMFSSLSSPSISLTPMPNGEDVKYLAEDSKGNLWLGFDSQGIGRVPAGHSWTDATTELELQSINLQNGRISSNQVICSFTDSRNRQWWGYYGGALQYIDSGGAIHSVENAHLRYVEAIDEDRRGRLWIATNFEGLYCMHPDGHTDAYAMDGTPLSTNNITDVRCYGTDSVFIGTSNGLYLLNAANGNMRQLSREHIKALYIDCRERLWAGMRNGLMVINLVEPSAATVTLTVNEGLSHNYVFGITEDHSGNIWVSTMEGVTKVHTLHDSQDTNSASYHCVSYYGYDGLGESFFNNHAITCLANGNILVGGNGVVACIVPNSDVRHAAERNAVRFTGLTLAGKRIEVGDTLEDGRVLLRHNTMLLHNLTFRYNDYDIGIEVSSANYLDQPHQRYVYRLGPHEPWGSMEENTVVLKRLASGRYMLQVKVQEADSSYQNPIYTLAIRVTPPFWYSLSAYIIYAILLLTIILALLLYVRKQSRKKLLAHKRAMQIQQRTMINEAKMRFFINISHDLRTPLSLIITPIERMLHGTLPDDVRHQMELINRSAHTLLEDITQLLDFRKLDESADAPVLQATNLTRFVNDTCRQFTEGLNLPGGVSLRLNLPAEDLWTDADTTKMRRILLNLISNAIKYNRPQGLITLSLERRDDTALLAISDTGIGIRNKEHIFERFYQERREGETTYIGSGIGLHMVQQYVLMHKGTISVKDNHPCGTTFTISLPLRASGAPANLSASTSGSQEGSDPQQDPEQAKGETTDGHVLIVEDNDDFRSFLHSCLIDHYRVSEAANGQEALNILEHEDISIIISDVMMPVMDGTTLCKRVKSDIRYSHIPFIMLTARATDENQIGGLRDGADDYIAKPFNLDILLLRINRLLTWAGEARQRFLKMEVSPSEITVSSIDEQLITKAIQHVEQRMSDSGYSVDNLCDAMGMSRSNLYKKLTAITGLSPILFIRTLRVKRGRALLEQSGEPVSQVAYRIGLSPKQFAKYFKEEYGISPSELKNADIHF